MNIRSIILFLVTHLFVSVVFGQVNFTISGTVRDQKETIPGAAIYLSGTKISTVANNDGKFTLNNLPAGNYDILIQVIGYLPYSQSITISDKSVHIDALLQTNTIALQEVVIKADPDRWRYINIFKRFFIGQTPNSKECQILNSDILIVDYNKQTKLLSVNSNDFLIIENKALGYRIKYLLKYFEYDFKTNILFYAGYPFFEEMKGSNSKVKRWNKKRNEAYYGSYQHFFQSLYKGSSEQEGFVMHKLITIPNKNRQPDSLINANIRKLTFGKNAINALTFNRDDSLNYWLRERSKPKNMAILNKAIVNPDTLVKVYNNDLKTINYTDELFIIYTKEKETEDYFNSGFYVNRAPDMGNVQVSLISLLEPPILFYQNGGLLNPKSFLFKGFWAYEKMADAVPIEYVPLP